MGTYPNNGGKPKFNEFQTPVGRIVHLYHDRPQEKTDDKTQKPSLDKDGHPEAEYKATLAWTKAMMDGALIPMRQLAAVTRDEAWPVRDDWFTLQTFLRDGDNPEHNTKRKEYLFGHVYLNFKAKAIPVLDAQGKFTGRYTGAPGLIGPYKEDLTPTDIWPGCTGRVSGIMFGSEYMGKNFISVRLNNIQKAADGERLGGGGRPDAKSQFDALATPPAGGGNGLTMI